MLPTLEIGPWHVPPASLLYALAVLVAGAFYLYRLVRRRFRAGPSARALLWIVLAGLAGANLGGGLALGYELLSGSSFPIPLKSNSILGALFSGGVVAWLICRHHHLSFWWVCDQAIPALPLGQAIGRLGCLVRGCCYGRPTESWLGLSLPDIWGDWAQRYPTQLLAGAADLLILAVLLGLETRFLLRNRVSWLFDGFLTLLYLGLYLLKRFSLEFLRGDALPAWIGPLNSTHVVCLAGLFLVLGAAGWKLRRAEGRAEA